MSVTEKQLHFIFPGLKNKYKQNICHQLLVSCTETNHMSSSIYVIHENMSLSIYVIHKNMSPSVYVIHKNMSPSIYVIHENMSPSICHALKHATKCHEVLMSYINTCH